MFDKELREKLAKKGMIKPLSEAFKDYPVEEEIHQGNINFFLCEKKVKYDKYDIGDIVFVREFKYADGSIGKNHLFIIIDDFNEAIPIEYLSIIVSSKVEKTKYKNNKLLLKDDKNNLSYNSIVKLDALYRIPKEQIEFKIGSVCQMRVQEYKKFLFEVLSN